MPPRILVFGTGAIGSVYTYVLSRQIPASDIVCICRSNYDAAVANGFTVNSSLWGQNLKVNPTIARSVDEAASSSASSPFDYILVTSKALKATPSIASQLRPAVSENTTIVLIQNGIDIEMPYYALYPNNPILSCVVYLPATRTDPTTTTHKEIELLHIGTYPSTDVPPSHKNAAETFSSLLTSCTATTKVHEDIQQERWSKLLVNAAWNPICALTRSNDAQFLQTAQIADVQTETLDYVRDVMLEISLVAQACGYDGINRDKVDFQIGRAKVRELPGIEPSMLADVRGGKRLEVDAIVGNAVRIAREKGVNTPLLRGLYVLLAGLDASFARERK